MARPLIGITAYAEPSARWGAWDLPAALVPLAYVRAIEEAGGRPLLVPPSEHGIEETLAALDHLVHQGKVRYIGASSGYAWEMARALSASERNGWARFISMQNHYNLLYREEEREMIPLCIAEGVGIVPWSPLARGRLARETPSPAAGTRRADNDSYAVELYDMPSDGDVIDAVRLVANYLGQPPAEVSLAWLLQQPGVVSPIIGATKIEHLDVAVRALDVHLSEENCRALEDPYRAHPVKGH